MKVTSFAKRLTAFLTEYLPAQRGVSPHTIRSYRDSFVLFLGFLRDECGLAPERVDLDHLRPDVIVRFLRYLAQERGCATGTCNLRLVAIHSFVKYLQLHEPGRMAEIQRVLAVPTRRFERGTVSYLSEKDLRTLLAQPDLTKPRERRDAVLLSLLYDTAALANEFVGRGSHAPVLAQPVKICADAEQDLITSEGTETLGVQLLKPWHEVSPGEALRVEPAQVEPAVERAQRIRILHTGTRPKGRRERRDEFASHRW